PCGRVLHGRALRVSRRGPVRVRRGGSRSSPRPWGVVLRGPSPCGRAPGCRVLPAHALRPHVLRGHVLGAG
ncbi:hypothetical protein, partial [Streptomyces sp. PU_AKi4]|uniref:hypothetical protein n=1 Tax=Streptomyces sp. PU_AKi4 TaxID=2800809 RepID=UPI0035253C0C